MLTPLKIATLSLALLLLIHTCPASAQTISASDAPASAVDAVGDDHFNPTLDPLPSFGSLFTDTARDFSHVGSSDTIKWLGVAAVAAAALHPLDRRVSNDLLGRADGTFASGQTIGSARFQLAGALATYAVGRIASSPTASAMGFDLLKAHMMAQVLTGGLKMSFRRTRPDGERFSFPSGHASVTFASATVLQRHFGWRVGIPAYAVATYVASSRIQEQRHYLSDVAFGAMLGIVAGRAVTFELGQHRLALSPTPVPGGAAISFTLGRR